MKKILLLFSFTLTTFSVRAASDQDQIADLGLSFAKAFNAGDGNAVAACFTADADYVDLDGATHSGRDAILALYTDYFASNKGAQVAIESESLRLLSADTAIEDGTTSVFGAEGTPPSRAHFTNILVKNDDQWLVASVRETPLLPPDRSAELGPLSWLLGEWQASTGEGSEVRLLGEVMPGGSFLTLQRLNLVGGVPVSRGSEWIAWDPTKKQIRSWNFEEDGTFGESTWKKDGASWVVESTHTLRDGGIVRESQSITVNSDGTLSSKSLGGTLNDQETPPTDTLVFKRSNNP